MIHSDNETAVDLLNKSAMVNSIVRAIRNEPNKPKTIGVYGDWGAGKSSILEMVEKDISGNNDRIMCIKFNCWRFQGFGDAKISIIQEIVKELINKQSLQKKAGAAVREILIRIDLLKAARIGSNLLFNLTSGIPSYDQMKILFQNSNYEKIIGKMNIFKNWFQSDQKKLPQEVSEFLSVFETLLESADIDQLVILIDDMDRCLPKFVVETLEALRLFLFAKRTAFVIAVDEKLVELSVKEHFPQRVDSQLSDDYAKKYIEKIIQLPYYISPMSEAKTQNYTILLMIGAFIGDDSHVFKELIEESKNFSEKPWIEMVLENKKISTVLGNKFDSVKDMLKTLEEINPIIAKGTKGNPRQVKRFLNTFILRENAAAERKFLESLDYQVLTKLLLVELFQTPLFDRISNSVSENSDGKCKEISILESAVKHGKTVSLSADVLQKLTDIRKPLKPELDIWTSGEALNWLKLEPALADIDLNPYLFISNMKRPHKENPHFDIPVDKNAETRLS